MYQALHRDSNPNLYLQLAGRKVIRMLAPDDGQSIFNAVQAAIGSKSSGKFRGDEMMKGQEKTLLENQIWVNETAKDGNEATGFEAILGAGESLFIPPGWWHSVKSLGTGCTGSVGPAQSYTQRLRQYDRVQPPNVYRVLIELRSRSIGGSAKRLLNPQNLDMKGTVSKESGLHITKDYKRFVPKQHRCIP
ncbi:MAG: hypothetical protein Q9201_004419 [Fulgogasparrea decipioides]